MYNNESCQKQVIISLSSPQALYYKVLLFFHFLLVFYLNWVDSNSEDVADNSIQLKRDTIILLSLLSLSMANYLKQVTLTCHLQHQYKVSL